MDTTISKFTGLPDDASEADIKNTASELEMLSFSPILLLDTPGFLYMGKQEITAEAERILSLPDSRLPEYDHTAFDGPEDFKLRQVDMLYFYYELLCRLRAGQPEAWDYIHELYEDD